LAVKRLLNLHEDATHKKLRAVCVDWDAHVYPKVRVADVLSIERSGISDSDYRYALQSHFDFVVTDSEHSPLFAVEFDGPSHFADDQRRKDTIKDQLCARQDFPLLRLKSNHLLRRYRDLDILTWIVECWFLQRAFDDAQERGQLPPDEGFDPLFVIRGAAGSKNKFPLWLSLDIREQIIKLADTGKILDHVATSAIGWDAENNARALAVIRISEKHGAIATTAVRQQLFPMPVPELASELIMFQLYEELNTILSGKKPPKTMRDIEEALAGFASTYKIGTYGGPTDMLKFLSVNAK
jgi:hypothetical protein